jgi:chemosensory pili system protein ChpA (sensor histidine kinase/response regulator)
VEAIEKLREGIPDVMLVDIEMPRMDGYELTSRVRSESLTRHIPIIIITSRAGAKHKQKAMELGANVYLTKPFQEEDLLAQIEPFLEDQRAVH